MNLHDRAEFERHLVTYVDVVITARNDEITNRISENDARMKIHCARYDLVSWVALYSAHRQQVALAEAARSVTPIKDTLGGP